MVKACSPRRTRRNADGNRNDNPKSETRKNLKKEKTPRRAPRAASGVLAFSLPFGFRPDLSGSSFGFGYGPAASGQRPSGNWARTGDFRDKGNRIREQPDRIREEPDRVRAKANEFREKAPEIFAPSDSTTFLSTYRNGLGKEAWRHSTVFREESTDFPDFCHIFQELRKVRGRK